MSGLINKLVADRIIFISLLVSFTAISIATVVVVLFYRQLPPIVPIFNQLAWGEGRLGTKAQISIPIVIAVIVFCMNPFIIFAVYKDMPLVSRILSVTTLIVATLVLIFVIRTIRIVL